MSTWHVRKSEHERARLGQVAYCGVEGDSRNPVLMRWAHDIPYVLALYPDDTACDACLLLSLADPCT